MQLHDQTVIVGPRALTLITSAVVLQWEVQQMTGGMDSRDGVRRLCAAVI